MRFSDPSIIAALAFNRVKSDAAGASVRAMLGEEGASVIPADHLGRGDLPARPLLAYRPGPVPTVAGVDVHNGGWLIYDDPGQGTYRIGQIAAALALAYDLDRGAPPLPSPAGVARVGSLSEPREDAALGLRFRRLDLTIDG
jgi:hypothetical protein